MTVSLTKERKDELTKLCMDMLQNKKVTIRKFAKLIGKMVAAEPGVQYAPLFYKPLEKVIDICLQKHSGDFDKFMRIPVHVKPHTDWWIVNLPSAYKPVSPPHPLVTIYSDASTKGWGAVNKTTNEKTGGQWSLLEQENNINILELTACQLALLSFCKHMSNTSVRIYMDNTTSCSYINKFGGKKKELDCLAREICRWCLTRDIHLSAAHVAGTLNSEADEMSRSFNDDSEWSLDELQFKKIQEKFPHLTIDLFASRLNNKLTKYASFRPEPNAYAIDAFSFSWTSEFSYIFSPFVLVPRILQKLEEDNAEAVMVVPIWTTQVWWASLLQLISGPCYLLPKSHQFLTLPHKQNYKHPLKKMRLAVFKLSGNRSKSKAFLQTQQTSSWNPGENPPGINMMSILENGFLFVENKLIPLNPL